MIYVRLGMWIFTNTLGAAAMADQSRFPLAQETAAWNQILKTNVREDGGVDYTGVAKNRATLETFIASYAKVDLAGTSDTVRKALYINLYNAGMMLNLLRHIEAGKISIESPAFLNLQINQIKIPGGNIWNGNYTFDLGGQKVTLDDIEHGLLRGGAKGALKPFKVSHLDPRIHAAVNCAALSCPPLRTQAYTPESVEAMLQENIQGFLSNQKKFYRVFEREL